jgi:imidazole glycerol-phosphate synthase subunit HisH
MASPANEYPLVEEAVSIGIVDYGMGNRRSVEKALEHIGACARLSSDPHELRGADGLLVPGVGAFPRAMANLRELGLDELLHESVAHGKPVLGVCLGMQLAFDRSTEQDGAAGLGIVPGEVRVLHSEGLKLPHIGWNEVRLLAASALTEGLPERCAFYHVHSYVPVPAHQEHVIGVAEYGVPFASIVEKGSFYGVQFHPEKSSAAGLRLLANFAHRCAAASAGENEPRVAGAAAQSSR